MFDLTSITSALNGRLPLQGNQSHSPVNRADTGLSSPAGTNGEGVTVSLSGASQSYYYESRVRQISSTTTVEAPQSRTPEQTAQNILDAIREKLTVAKNEGADKKEIRSLLKEASRGFKKGFREASRQLDRSGALDKDLKSELKETKKLVKQGLKELRREFSPRRSHGPAHDHDVHRSRNTSTLADTQPTKTPAPVDEKVGFNQRVSFSEQINFSQSTAIANRSTHSQLQRLAESHSAAFSTNQSAFVEITTRDGDVVTIDLANAIAASKSFNSNGDFEFSISAMSSENILVEGVLDEGEMIALQDLLAQVDSLADKFFSGDVSAAFQQAQSMGFDTDEIASFSLDFSQSTQIQATSAYLDNVGPDQASEQIQKQSGFETLADYTASMRHALDSAANFSQPANLLSALLSSKVELVDSVPPLDEIERFNSVNDQLIEGIEQL